MTGTPTIPDVARATTPAQLDAAVGDVRAHGEAWLTVGVPERVAILDELRRRTAAVAARWVALACAAKGISTSTAVAGEEWLAGPALVARNLRLLARSLADVATRGAPRLPRPPFVRADGIVVAPVFPTDRYDPLLFPGVRGEVWMDPGLRLADLPGSQAVRYRPGAPRVPRVAVVLGAGNVSSIAPMDALYKLFVDDCVVVLKLNPVNDYLGSVLAEVFQPLVAAGFLRIVHGGAEAGAHLTRHPDVAEVHMTGSDKTYEAVVWGGGRRTDKRVTAELGNVTPVVVVPGRWSRRELDHQAANVATMVANNAGFNCIAARVLVTSAGWPQRAAFLDAVRGVLAGLPTRRAYYPGAGDRYETFLAAHPDAERIGSTDGDALPWTLVTGLDPDRRDDVCFTTEPFCPVLAEVSLAEDSVEGFVDAAVRFCNERLWGTLSAMLLVHPASLRDPAVAAAVERAVADLRYGVVVVNSWSGLAFGLSATTWGAFPADGADVGCGAGVVHNSYLFDRAGKSVLRGPFRARPTPSWYATNRRAHRIGERYTAFEVAPSPLRLAGLLAVAARG